MQHFSSKVLKINKMNIKKMIQHKTQYVGTSEEVRCGGSGWDNPF